MASKKKKSKKTKVRKPSGRKKASSVKRKSRSYVKSRVKSPVKKRKARKRKQPEHLAKGLTRYHVIASAIRAYYRETGKELTRSELKAVYAKIKASGAFANVPLNRIEDGIATYLSARDKGTVPTYLIMFPWFDLAARFMDKPALGFFKESDNITLDLSDLELEPSTFQHKDTVEAYHQLYPQISNTLRQFESDQIPQFIFIEQKGNEFVWKLDVAHKVPIQPASAPGEIAPSKPPVPGAKEEVTDREISILKQREMTAKAEALKYETELKYIEKLEKLGYTPAEIRKKLG